MTLLGNASNQTLVPFSYPTENEKCGANISFPEQFKNLLCVPLHATLEVIPVPSSHGRVESGYLEMLFDVEC